MNEGATNQACCAVLPKSSPFGREFAFLTLFINRERIIGLRLGAAQQNISQVLLKKFECIKPPDKLVDQLSKRTAPLLDGICVLQRQIKNLYQTRDLLLPRLLSGELLAAEVELTGLPTPLPKGYPTRKEANQAALTLPETLSSNERHAHA